MLIQHQLQKGNVHQILFEDSTDTPSQQNLEFLSLYERDVSFGDFRRSQIYLINQKHSFEILYMIFNCQNLKVSKLPNRPDIISDFDLKSFLTQVDSFVEQNLTFVETTTEPNQHSSNFSFQRNQKAISHFLSLQQKRDIA